NLAALQTDGGAASTLLKSRLYLSGVLSHCVAALRPGRLQESWSAAATLAQLTCCCCVGVQPGRHSEAFHRLFLPSVVDALLSLAGQLMRRAERCSLFRTLMDSVGRLLSAHAQLSAHGQSDHRLLIRHAADRDADPHSSVLNLNSLLHASQGRSQVSLWVTWVETSPVRLSAGLDSLLDKDWRGRGFDQDVDQLIALVSTEHVQAACVIQAAWRSYRTRRRVKSLSRAVSTLQRRYRARRRRQQQQTEARRWEEELSYQVFVRRQQARRRFHQKQRRLLQLLPADQVQSYLQEVERRAAVVIQSFWRGFRERRRYQDTQRHTLRQTQKRQQAAMTLQTAVCPPHKKTLLDPFGTMLCIKGLKAGNTSRSPLLPPSSALEALQPRPVSGSRSCPLPFSRTLPLPSALLLLLPYPSTSGSADHQLVQHVAYQPIN
uniref:IQ motif containing B1 n=1 Tax=Stegastes partitus TaxID=144197 RepID=A0A3B4ZH71_9TELE